MNENELFAKGIQLFHGTGIPKDARAAVGLFREAHKLGYAPATTMLGVAYDVGMGVGKDTAKAETLFREAATQGESAALHNLGMRRWQSGQFEEAIRRFNQAVRSGSSLARVALGRAYAEGNGVQKDLVKAAEAYAEAAEEGCHAGVMALAHCFLEGRGVPCDTVKAARLFEIGCTNDDADACLQLGLLILAEDSDSAVEEALRNIDKAAELGCPDAQQWAGEYYAMCDHNRRDLNRGISLLRRAVAGDMPRAKYLMAVLMAVGKGVEKDAEAAFNLCQEAASAGEADAQLMIARMLNRGEGTRKDLRKSEKWYQRAARTRKGNAKKTPGINRSGVDKT